jgi:hypothetical protein
MPCCVVLLDGNDSGVCNAVKETVQRVAYVPITLTHESRRLATRRVS